MTLQPKPTREEMRELVANAKRAVESQLPEDEPDFTAQWVYEATITLAYRAGFNSAIAKTLGASSSQEYKP